MLSNRELDAVVDVKTQGSAGAGLWSPELTLRLHHIGYVIAEVEEIADAYVQRLGYELSSLIIHDPLQTAFVQFLKLAGDAVYLEFVAPDGPESKLASAAKRRPGLNHLCYTSGLLETTIAKMEQGGLRLISEPKPGIAFGGRRICWLIGADLMPVELVERRYADDPCEPGVIEEP